MKIADKEIEMYVQVAMLMFDNKFIKKYYYANKGVTLKMILDLAKQNGYKQGLLIVITENYKSGTIFKYGNYLDNEWYKVGTTCGFA